MITVAQSTVNTVVRYMQINVSLKTIKQMNGGAISVAGEQFYKLGKKLLTKDTLK